MSSTQDAARTAFEEPTATPMIASGLIGRSRELRQLGELLEATRAGHSRSVILRGEPGVGKSALLDAVAEHANGYTILRAAGVQAEMELAFAGLHQLLMPISGQFEALPGPQREAISVAFGINDGPTPDRFFIALAVLNVLASASTQAPVLCLIDDEQWLDRTSTQILGFVARRLDADPVSLIFASRAPSDTPADIPEMAISGLAASDSDALLDEALHGPFDPQIRAQILHEAAGNPLALLELPGAVNPSELAGGFGLPQAMALSGRIENSFTQRLEALPKPSRNVMQLAAADPVGDPALIWRAATFLDLDIDAVRIAVESGLIEFGVRVQFRHPLVRSAAYRSASQSQRHAIHEALARATDSSRDPDRHAWHRAQASAVPDEDVATELECSAERAHARGGFAAASAFLESAAALTPSPPRRALRLMAAAQAKRDAGALDEALGLLVAAVALPHDALQAASMTRLRGQIAQDQLRVTDAVQLLQTSAGQFGSLRSPMARITQLEALDAAVWVGDTEGINGLRAVARGIQEAASTADPAGSLDVLLEALAARVVDGHPTAAPKLRTAIAALLRTDGDTGADADWLWLMRSKISALLAPEVWDFDAWHAVALRETHSAREIGALVYLQFAAVYLAWTFIQRGDFSAAEMLCNEDRLLAEATGNAPLVFVSMLLAAWRGEGAENTNLYESEIESLTAAKVGLVADFLRYAKSVLFNGIGRHKEALAHARRAFAANHIGMGPFVAAEVAEAAAHTGDTATLNAVLDWITGQVASCPTDWALGIESRVHALLSQDADEWHQQSITHLSRAGLRLETGRAHLLYGEWLRRAGRRIDARYQLRTAEEMLSRMGADGFAARARRELSATGEVARKRSAETARDTLTSQELHVALLARDGLSNLDIGTRLFISPRTAQYHLGKVFTKLGIRSRGELTHVLDSDTRSRLPSDLAGPGPAAHRR